jgi:hypothetical protein
LGTLKGTLKFGKIFAQHLFRGKVAFGTSLTQDFQACNKAIKISVRGQNYLGRRHSASRETSI